MLQILAALHGQDHILMECTFPADYPNKPFFLRIISPRMCWYTGEQTLYQPCGFFTMVWVLCIKFCNVPHEPCCHSV